jgi:5-methylcytosine-specific restriction endonuclease McrA
MTYSEKLRDPRWQKKRLHILERDNWTCILCGAKEKPLQVHHVLYLKINPWDYPDHLLQTLCDDCHAIRGELTDKIANAVRIAIKNVPTERLIIVSKRICAEAMLEIEVEV